MTLHIFFCNSINKNPPKHLYLIDTLLMTDMTSPYRHVITEILLNVALSTINHHFHPVSTSFKRHTYMLYIYIPFTCTTKAVVVVIAWIYNYLCNQCLSPLYHPLFITPIQPLYHSSILYRWVV